LLKDVNYIICDRSTTMNIEIKLDQV